MSPTAIAASPITLRDYQREALDASAVAAGRDCARQIIALPTGTGKTVVFCEMIRRRGGRALILVHRDELVQQAIEKMAIVAPDLKVGVVKAERDEVHAQVVVASVQTLSRPARLGRMAFDFDTVIVDEAHHATAPSYRTILEAAGCFQESGEVPLLVGVTATPERGDGAGLDTVFEAIVYQRDILEMIVEGYLADLRAFRVTVKGMNLDNVRTTAGDFREGDLGAALMMAHAPDYAVEAYQKHAAGRRAIVFTPTVEVAHLMAAAFQGADIPAEAVSGETPLDERRAILARFRAGQTRVVANCAVLTEGFDDPGVDCIIVARPTKSRPLYVQMVGRGTRVHPGKEDCIILDLVGVTRRHQLATASDLSGLAMQQGESILEARARIQAEREAAKLSADARAKLVSERVDLVQTRKLHWASDPAGTLYVLGLGDEGTLRVVPNDPELTSWRLIHVGPKPSYIRTVIVDGQPLTYCVGTAEDQARANGAGVLLDKAARWRSQPASDAQRAALERWYPGASPTMSKGKATDLLTVAIAAWDERRQARNGVR